MSRIIRAKIEEELEKSESKVEYLEGIWNFMSGTPPSIEGSVSTDKSEEAAKAKTEYKALSKQFQETSESYKKKMEEVSIKLEGIKSPATATAVSQQQECKVFHFLILRTLSGGILRLLV